MSQNDSRDFKPSLVSTLIMLVALIVSCFLAYWQNGRIDEKRALQAQYSAMLSAPALSLNKLIESDYPLLDEQQLLEKQWQRVSVKGQFLEEFQFLLDSQVFKGKPGYNAIIPLRIENTEHIVLINRGWIPAGENREQIPKIPPLTETQPIFGQLAKPKTASPGFQETSIDNKVQLFINLAALSDKIGSPLLPMIIQLDERTIGPLPRKWPEYQAKVEMHEFYVLHWLVVALLSLFIYIYFAFKPKQIPN